MTEDILKLIARFNENNRPKIASLISEWRDVKAGSKELIFLQGKISVFRACPYNVDHLIVRHAAGTSFGAHLVECYGGKELEKTVSIPLEHLPVDDIPSLLDKVKAFSSGTN